MITIKQNKAIENYLTRAKKNLYNNYQNDYLDLYVDQKNEKLMRKALLKAGQLELKDPKVSLFIDPKEFTNNKYIKNINFDNVKLKDFSYEKVIFKKGYLFNYDDLQDDPDKNLNDFMSLRALSKDIETLVLKQNNKTWMMAVPSEFKTNDVYAAKAKGNVLCFGLGIGYFVYMCCLNKKVKSITVIENSKDVIKLFNSIKNQFPNKPIKIINGDAFDYFNEKTINKYDYVYVDIYKSNIDGLKTITKLLEQYNPDFDKCNFWIEKSCTNVIRTLLLLYFDEKLYNHPANVDKYYQKYMKKIDKYYNRISSLTINDYRLLKELVFYNQMEIREILATK